MDEFQSLTAELLEQDVQPIGVQAPATSSSSAYIITEVRNVTFNVTRNYIHTKVCY